MTIAILATGDEIVHGDTLNTNAHEIAHALSSEGLSLGLHMECSDKETDIIDCLNVLTRRHDLVILIGGLGPTTDDLTRFALAKYTGDKLVQHDEALEHIKNRMQAAKVPINEGNLQQCLFPAQAQILPNPNGSAVGCFYQWNDKTFILLPGPPRECLPMFNNHVLPLLQQREHSTKHIIKWRIFGLAESEIAQILEEALRDIDCNTGYRLDTPYIEFKVRCASDVVNEIKAIINPILSPHIIASVEQKASDNLRELVLSTNEPITIIDEVTGGLLQTLLVKPGNPNLFHFHHQQNTKIHFHLKGLEEYWQQQLGVSTSQLTINYSNHHQEGGETHQIPYRGPLVVYYAAEWLSFRLFHLINQLHQ
ncbi:competence/damage-inducible protein A [uncultured Legionella sp.]|uniref:competence/damage-inducible protein A n=1 Tax=uncultured Legionella sp. TaxID=210934 RepID=UPI00345D3BA1